MWAVGITLLILTTSLIVVAWSEWHGPSITRGLWDLPEVATSFMHISGTLAALSLASAVFIATLAPDSPTFESSIALFIFSFLILIAAAMQFAALPNLPQTDGSIADGQYVSYVIANCSFYLGIALSWLGLRLLLLAIHLEDLAAILTWVLLLSILAGAMRLSMHLYRHGTVNGLVCLLLPAVALGFSLLYRFGVSELWSSLWPDSKQPLDIALFGIAITASGYVFQTALLALYGSGDWAKGVERAARTWLVAYGHSVVVAVALTWIAVAQA